MNIVKQTLNTLALGSALVASAVLAGPLQSTSKLLTAHFDSRQVVKIEAGDFHFVPGQVASIHTHEAPVLGYVARGQIVYQVEGEKPQLLREGDAFYEPAGPRILRFDNASATQEAVFIDFNLQREGEPFIVFEKELTEKIDRRSLPSVALSHQAVKQVDVFVSELKPGGRKVFKQQGPLLAYVAEGIVNVKRKGKTMQRIKAGETFTQVSGMTQVSVVNLSLELPAKIVAFYLR